MDDLGYDALLENAKIAATLDPGMFRHLASRMAILTYLRIADEIVANLGQARILDWGCGFGQVSYLLKQRGLDVVSYDVGPAPFADQLPVSRSIQPVIGSEPVNLPYANGAFDAVLSCGVLEHVPDENGSLDELYRVLRVDGKFFIYNLPNRTSYKEYLIERMHLGYTHERKYTFSGLAELLRPHGFRLVQARYSGMLPHTLTGFPARVRSIYNQGARAMILVDRVVSRIPGVQRLAEALEAVALRTD